jgi:cytochrome c
MKKVLVIVGAAVLSLSAGVAQAQAGMDTAKANGCMNCHTVDKKKMGPALKTVAADWKANKVDAAKAVSTIKAKHPDLKAKDEDLKAIVGWISGL